MLKNLLRIKNDQPKRVSWKELLRRHAPLLLPAAHDGLTAKLIEHLGFKAYQVGGFALAGARHGFPDIDLVHYGEQSAGVRNILAASSLPVMVDADDGYGDVKNVTRTIEGYEALGASAIFFEDQLAPKECGHMEEKEVIPADKMVAHVKAAVAARSKPETFLIARTDARYQYGLDEAMRRAELYLKAGADGIFIEAPGSVEELEAIGRRFKGTPMIANMLEGGGKTPVLTPHELHGMGFDMITYPTTVLFRVTRAIERALKDILNGTPMSQEDSVTFKEFETIVDKQKWTDIEKRCGKG
ncbi:MAG: isocitrate lyase/PEP mutase family protein [Alphaproteobacteria bacterium]|nr:isocitrate lyase/PEP mutase family protein [Alphaproteobacteria bacterium]